ncbi:hypothetical protein NMY22_g2930 [Coprinellus aureogranulatus]|nr:hypothetical protein NMY22_g2930 [Coprinellus aureogranulatus]
MLPPPTHAREEHPLSKNNVAPSQQEALLVREQLAQAERERSHLARRLAHIQADLDDQVARIESFKHILAPVRRLPLEVLGEIFLRIPTSQFHPRNYQKSVARVSLVCKSWCSAARSTPQLWADVWVKMDVPGVSYDSLMTWTSRAGSLERNVEISSPQCGGVTRREGTTLCRGEQCLFSNIDLARFLLDVPGRWSSVILGPPTPVCLRRFVASLYTAGNPDAASGSWNFIDSFKIDAYGMKGMSLNPDFILTFLPTKLKSLSVHLPRISTRDGGIFHIAWSKPLAIPPIVLNGLTSLNLKFDARVIYASSLFYTLRHCSSLETLEVDFSVGQFGSFIDDDAMLQFEHSGVLLPELRLLRLRQVHADSLTCLKLISFPKLVELSISFGEDGLVDRDDVSPNFSLRDDDDDEDDDGLYDGVLLANFIADGGVDRNPPSGLQILHLKGISFVNGALHYILRTLPALTQLKLEWVGISGDDFHRLMEDSPAPLRELKMLEIAHLKYPSDGEVPSLRAFAEARGVDLKLSVHNRAAWEQDDKRFMYLAGLESDSEDEF